MFNQSQDRSKIGSNCHMLIKANHMSCVCVCCVAFARISQVAHRPQGERMRFYCIVLITSGSFQLCWVLLWSLLWCGLLFSVYLHLLGIFSCTQHFVRIYLLLPGMFGECVPGFPFLFCRICIGGQFCILFYSCFSLTAWILLFLLW